MKKIIIVDDDPQVVAGLKRALHGLPVTFHEAHDGDEAIAFVREIKPALMILDVCMPGLDGIEVCKILREEEIRDDALRPLPIIILSGLHQEADKIVGKVVGADYYFTKPCDSAELRGLVEKLIQ